MKTKILKLTILLLIIVGSLSSCDKLRRFEWEYPEFDSYNKEIVGKWKLVEVKIPYARPIPISFDYSQYDIVYEFTKKGILSVIGDVDSIDLYLGHEPGIYSYSFTYDGIGGGTPIPGEHYGLKIGEYFICWYRISSEKLEIIRRHVDGVDRYLIRIN